MMWIIKSYFDEGVSLQSYCRINLSTHFRQFAHELFDKKKSIYEKYKQTNKQKNTSKKNILTRP